MDKFELLYRNIDLQEHNLVSSIPRLLYSVQCTALSR